MKLPASLDWKVRAAIDLTVAAAFIVTMYSQGAPTWSLTLVLYLATKPSRMTLAGDMSALQTTIVNNSTTIGEAFVAGERAASGSRNP